MVVIHELLFVDYSTSSYNLLELPWGANNILSLRTL